jgi:hypothetical protein
MRPVAPRRSTLATCVLGLSIILALQCGSSPDSLITGDWSGNDGKGVAIMLRLTKDGDSISGTACMEDTGHLIYSNVPVSGHGNTLSFTVGADNLQPCCPQLAGGSLTATFHDDDNRWHGAVRQFVGATATDVVFSRPGDLCAGASSPTTGND